MNIKSYYEKLGLDPFEVAIPLTFHIKKLSDKGFQEFLLRF
jgi:hypothetical protein